MSQSSHPTLINMPQPPSRPDTPSEAPGTPTSTTTSLSALSTTAIKDGHRGQAHGHPATTYRAGHQHTLSSTSLEAERADRISRLTGLSNVSALRNTTAYPYSNAGFVPPPYNNPYHTQQQQQQQYQYHPHHPQQYPTPGGGVPHMLNGVNLLNPPQAAPLTPAYFDTAGQPVAATKLSTVGSASATESIAGRTNDNSSPSPSSPFYDGSSSTRREDDDDVPMREDGGYDEHEDGMLSDRDRDDDDDSASLVGFGEGAGSTVSGPIYQRRLQRVGEGSAASAMASWGRGERGGSGLGQSSGLRMESSSVAGSEGRGGGDTPVTQAALQERREAAMVNGVALDGGGGGEEFVDTSTRGPVPMGSGGHHQANVSAIRETQQPGSYQQQQHQQQQQQWRSAAERIVGERLDEGEGRPGVPALGRAAPVGEGGQRSVQLGQFYFEEGRR